MVVGKSTLAGKILRLSKSAEQTVPPSDVPIVEPVDIQLMMDRMMLRPLKKIADPTRCA
jgi:hypothetical protein